MILPLTIVCEHVDVAHKTRELPGAVICPKPVTEFKSVETRPQRFLSTSWTEVLLLDGSN